MSGESTFQPVITAKVTLHITLRPMQYGPGFSLQTMMEESRRAVHRDVREMLERANKPHIGADLNNIIFDLELKGLKVSG